jgi:hypothetical protein
VDAVYWVKGRMQAGSILGGRDRQGSREGEEGELDTGRYPLQQYPDRQINHKYIFTTGHFKTRVKRRNETKS